jgi:hypothetical protein
MWEFLENGVINSHHAPNNGMHPTPRHVASHVRCVGARVMRALGVGEDESSEEELTMLVSYVSFVRPFLIILALVIGLSCGRKGTEQSGGRRMAETENAAQSTPSISKEEQDKQLADAYYALEKQLKAKAADWYKLRRRTRLQNPPYLRGKVAIINSGEFAGENNSNETPYVDLMSKDVPDELRPASIDEIGTIVLTTWTDREIGVYRSLPVRASDNRTAFEYRCTIKIIDLSLPAVINVNSFNSPPPPTQYDPKFYGRGLVEKQVLDYLKSLERR